VSWSRLIIGVIIKYQIVSEIKKEEILKTRLSNLQMDMEMLENQKERINEQRAELVLKLVATRESLLSLKEQDE
jgi:uncharacterized membrane-anchored protein YhcB (DUF1043 family)